MIFVFIFLPIFTFQSCPQNSALDNNKYELKQNCYLKYTLSVNNKKTYDVSAKNKHINSKSIYICTISVNHDHEHDHLKTHFKFLYIVWVIILYSHTTLSTEAIWLLRPLHFNQSDNTDIINIINNKIEHHLN